MNSIERFTENCREHHLKITPQRIAIYRRLQDNRQHPTADTVYRELKSEFPSISLDTVNRTLLTFADIGIVDIVEGHGSPRRFDPDRSPHHHFTCIRCGTITDFHDPRFDALEIPRDIAERFTVTGKRVCLSGICERCR